MAPIDSGVMAHTMVWEFLTMGAGFINCPEPTPKAMFDIIHSVPVTAIATRPDVVMGPLYDSELRSLFAESSVKKLLLGGGFLTNERRNVLEQLWGADCYALFGMSELFGPMASECLKKDGFHYKESELIVEIINPSTMEPVEEGDKGIAVYTTLWEKGFPLLRYWTDDVFSLDRSTCECRLGLPRLRYWGRLADCCAVSDSDVSRFNPSIHRLEDVVFAPALETGLFGNGLFGEYECLIVDGKAIVRSERCDYGSIDEQGAKAALDNIFRGKVDLIMVDAGSINRSRAKTRITHTG